MKSKFLIIIITAGLVDLFASCNGDHSTRVVRDTVANRYGTDTAKTAKTNLDTSKITTTTGDASSIDNSGSGGTSVAKDSSKKKVEKNK
jgi:hypothetical protein